jgi:rhamnosyltransferase
MGGSITRESQALSDLEIAPRIITRNYMVAAVVVLYHPELPLLARLLESVLGQVDTVIVVDNTSMPSAEFSEFFEKYNNRVVYIPLGENMGIATAQNVGIRKSLSEGYSHVLLLDQDSFPPVDMVNKLLSAERKLLQSGKNVASVGPIFIDEKSGATSKAIRHALLHVRKLTVDATMEEPVEADYLIASGSLIRTLVLADLGAMRDELFIDWVDIEWGLRARRAGSKCYLVPDAVMKHSIGDTYVHLIGKNINLHNDTRNYYIVRNAVYLLRLKSMGWRWRLITVLKIPLYVCFYSWHSSNMWNSFLILCKALSDGVRGRVGRLA